MNIEKLLVKEHESPKYPPRTLYNATSADVTIALAVDMESAGEKLTHKMAGKKYIGFQLEKNVFAEDVAEELAARLKKENAQSLNIAGNGIYTFEKFGYSQEQINFFVYHILKNTIEIYPIKKIYTGGQTGVDIAGAIAGYALGIETEVTFPKGYMQKTKDGKTIWNKKEDIEKYIVDAATQLLAPVVTKKNKP